MSRLLSFYRGQGTDAEGRFLRDIWTWEDDDLEAVHDFIQWLFPLPEPSQFNPDAPLLTEKDIAAFKSDPVLRDNLMSHAQSQLAPNHSWYFRRASCDEWLDWMFQQLPNWRIPDALMQMIPFTVAADGGTAAGEAPVRWRPCCTTMEMK